MYRNRTYFNVNHKVPSSETLHMPDSPMWAKCLNNQRNVSNIENTEEPRHQVLFDTINTGIGALGDLTFGNNSTQDGNVLSTDEENQHMPNGNGDNQIVHRNLEVIMEDPEDEDFNILYASHINDLLAVRDYFHKENVQNRPSRGAEDYSAITSNNNRSHILHTPKIIKSPLEKIPSKKNLKISKRKIRSEGMENYRESIFMQSRKGIVNRSLPRQEFFGSDSPNWLHFNSPYREHNVKKKFEEWRNEVHMKNQISKEEVLFIFIIEIMISTTTLLTEHQNLGGDF